MPNLKLVYYGFPGRAEPVRLALSTGGVEFEDEITTGEKWGTGRKAEVAPKQLPLLYVDGKPIGQSMALMRYAAKLSKVAGQPLYPEDPLEALLVDEFCDYVAEVFPPFAATFSIPDETERGAARKKLFTEGGDAHKWLKYVDDLLLKSSSGFAVGDRLTMADLAGFCFIQPLASGHFDGLAVDCLSSFKGIAAHRAKIAAIPAIKARYANAEGVFKCLQ